MVVLGNHLINNRLDFNTCRKQNKTKKANKFQRKPNIYNLMDATAARMVAHWRRKGWRGPWREREAETEAINRNTAPSSTPHH